MKTLPLIKFEIFRQLKNALVFSVVWSMMIVLFMSLYDTIKASSDQLSQLYASFPKGLLDAFGKGQSSLTSLDGYFANQITIYLFITGSIFAIFLVVGTLAREIENKNIIFLLSKPISRASIYFTKLTAIVGGLALTNVILFAVTVLAIKLLTSEPNLDIKFIILNYLAIWMMEILFVGIAALISMLFGSGKATGFGSMLVLFSYLINVMSALAEQVNFLKYLSFNHYLDPALLNTQRVLQPESIFIPLLGIVLILVAYRIFQRKDIS